MKNEMSCEKKSPVVPIAIGGVITLIAAAYVVSPLDIIPDILVGLGQLDDLAVGVIGVAFDIGLAFEAIRRIGGSGGSSNTPVNTCTGNFVDAEFVEV